MSTFAGMEGIAANRPQHVLIATPLEAEQVPALYLFDLPFLNIQAAKLRGMWKNQPIPECDVTAAYWAD